MRGVKVAVWCVMVAAAAACACGAAGGRRQGRLCGGAAPFGAGTAESGLPAGWLAELDLQGREEIEDISEGGFEEPDPEDIKEEAAAEPEVMETVRDVPAAAGTVETSRHGMPAEAAGGEAAGRQGEPEGAAPAAPAGAPAPEAPPPAPSGSWLDASAAYAALAAFRSSPENHWFWNEDGTAKVPVSGLSPLVPDPALEETARLRAKEQWEQFYVNKTATHVRPDGSSCFTVYPPGLSARGENLAWGHPDGNSVINGWAESGKSYAGQAHRRNILDVRFTRVGIACYCADGRTCWAMCLGG